MKQYSYADKKYPSPEGLFNNDSPLQFLRGFSDFYRIYHNDTVRILYSDALDAFIPVRYYKVKMFRFAQILHAPISNNIELNAEEQQDFFEELIAFHKEEQLCQRFVQPHPFGILKAVPSSAQSCPFGTYINNLYDHSEEELLLSFDPKYRKSVNHAAKNGAVIRTGWECFDDFYALYQNTTSKAGIHCDSRNYFSILHDCLGDNHLAIGVVYDNTMPIGAVLLLYTNYSALCTHAGSGGESKLYGGMKLLHYEMMKMLKRKGVLRYDLVGVRINSNNEALEGIFRFKKGFGGELKNGYLWKADIASLHTKVFDLMMRLKNKNRRSHRDIIDEESN